MLLWCDGFDHYGSTETFMLDGIYGDAANVELSTSQFATGTHSLYFRPADTYDAETEAPNLRKVLPSSTLKAGALAHFYFPNLPEHNDVARIFCFMTSDPSRSQVDAVVDANGCIRFYTGCKWTGLTSTGTLVAQSDPLINAASQNHIEVQVYVHATLGWVRVAINGVHRFEATGLDTQFDSSEIVSIQTKHYVESGQSRARESNDFFMDNLIIYDFEGDSAVDTDFCPPVDGDGIASGYIGELQCMYQVMEDDTAEADWDLSTGSDGFALVDEVSPNDADYIESDTVGDLTEFEIDDLPPEITYIRGLQLLGRLSKTDAGAAFIKFGMNSDGTTEDADERPVTVEPTYWWDFMNVDPDSGARWTRTSFNAAKFRITRSV